MTELVFDLSIFAPLHILPKKEKRGGRGKKEAGEDLDKEMDRVIYL